MYVVLVHTPHPLMQAHLWVTHYTALMTLTL